MASIIYNTFKGKDANDWAAGVATAYKCMLVTATYVPDPDHLFPNATGLATNEVTGGSYARQNMANRVKAVNLTTDSYDHSADNVTFTALAGPAAPRYAIIYRTVTADTDHQLVACIDLGTGLSVVGDFMVKWNGGATSGIVFKGT